MTFNKFTLSFTKEWAHLESQFLHTHFKMLLSRIRIAIVILLMFYGIFGILDAIVVPEKKHLFWLIRYAFVMPVASAVLIFSFFNWFEKYAQLCLFIMCLTGGFGIELMVILADPPATFSYYAGIILVFIAIHNFLPLRFIYGSICSCSIVIFYEVISFWIVDTPWQIWVNNNFFFVSALLLCMITGYYREISARQMFFSTHLLALEKQKIARINEELDQRVKERTRALHKKQKMEAIGTLAGGIAHDFNNILSAIMGYTELALMEIDPESKTADSLEQVMAAGNRATDLTRQILTFSRQNEQEVAPMAVKPVVKEALKLITASTPSRIRIYENLESDAWIEGDPTQVHRIVINLCTNSVHAMEDGNGSLEVTLEEAIIDAGFPGEKDQLTPGQYLVLSVSDTGHGMKQDVIDKIFDPFFTTKAVDHGTGMGLSVVHGIVKQYNGTIKVYSEPGQGTTFSLFFPICQKVSHAEPESDEQHLEGDEKIVVVDDETAITDVLDKQLSAMGYKVSAFTRASEAVRYIRENAEEIDLVITDFTMPEMTGLELSEKISGLNLGIPIILCTGYGENITRLKMRPLGIKGFLMKPLIRQRLLSSVRNLLDETERRDQNEVEES